MFRTTLRAMLAALAVSCLSGFSTSTTAQAGHPDIFYNFYAGPRGYYPVAPTQLYVAPLPSPPLVGHTWNTYPPLMPHEFLYHHHRSYYKHSHDGGYTVSRVHYR